METQAATEGSKAPAVWRYGRSADAAEVALLAGVLQRPQQCVHVHVWRDATHAPARSMALHQAIDSWSILPGSFSC
jgi:hypothetical protein